MLSGYQKNTKKNYCGNLGAENIKLKGRMNHLNNYSRRDNLVIGGIKESDNETGENCEELVRAFFITKLKMEPDNVERIRFVRCHRMGGNTTNTQPLDIDK